MSHDDCYVHFHHGTVRHLIELSISDYPDYKWILVLEGIEISRQSKLLVFVVSCDL